MSLVGVGGVDTILGSPDAYLLCISDCPPLHGCPRHLPYSPRMPSGARFWRSLSPLTTSSATTPLLHPPTPPHPHPTPKCSLEELLRPELRDAKYAALNLRRVALVLDKYRELDRSSGYAAMHRSKQAEVGRGWGGESRREGR